MDFGGVNSIPSCLVLLTTRHHEKVVTFVLPILYLYPRSPLDFSYVIPFTWELFVNAMWPDPRLLCNLEEGLARETKRERDDSQHVGEHNSYDLLWHKIV